MTGFRIGRIFGIDVQIHGSWLLIAGLILWSLASAALPSDFPDVGAGARMAMAVLITFLFFISLLAHELAHSVVAMVRGIPVDRITFFLFGGMAQTSSDSRSAGEEFLIAAAGPLMSFLLAGLFSALWYLGMAAELTPVLVGTAAYIAVLNLILGTFNLLPGFPMDGGRILRAAIWRASGNVTQATRWAARVGEAMAWLLIAWGFWQLLSGDAVGGIWIIFIGWFIRHAARTSYRQHLMARMQAMAQETFSAHYHRHPLGRRRPWPGPARPDGASDATERSKPRRRGEPGAGRGPAPDGLAGPAGRDVTHLGERD